MVSAVPLQALASFCGLNALCAFFVSFCFQRGIFSLAIPAVLRGWDLSVKSRACEHAGIAYVVLGCAFWFFSQWKLQQEESSESTMLLIDSNQRLQEYLAGENPYSPSLGQGGNPAEPLLSSRDPSPRYFTDGNSARDFKKIE